MRSSWTGPGNGLPWVVGANVGVFHTRKEPAIVPDVFVAVDVKPGQIGLFAVLVVLLVLIQIVGAILLAVVGKLSGTMDGRHDTDERDKLIGLKSTRNGSYILAVGVCMSLCSALVTQGNFVFMNLLLGFWVLAQLVEIGSQLVQYRRGA